MNRSASMSIDVFNKKKYNHHQYYYFLKNQRGEGEKKCPDRERVVDDDADADGNWRRDQRQYVKSMNMHSMHTYISTSILSGHNATCHATSIEQQLLEKEIRGDGDDDGEQRKRDAIAKLQNKPQNNNDNNNCNKSIISLSSMSTF